MLRVGGEVDDPRNPVERRDGGVVEHRKLGAHGLFPRVGVVEAFILVEGLGEGLAAVAEPEDGRIREKGTTENIVWSARLNVRNMLLGMEMESQW